MGGGKSWEESLIDEADSRAKEVRLLKAENAALKTENEFLGTVIEELKSDLELERVFGNIQIKFDEEG